MIGGTLLCIGDSLTYGARDELGLHYPELLARKLSKEFDQYWTAVNHGISGQTTPEILRRCYGHVRSYPEAAEVFLWAGFNDAKVSVSTPVPVYEENMASMIRSILFAGRVGYLFLLPEMKGFGAPDFVNNETIQKYNEVLVDLANFFGGKTKRLYLVDVRDVPAETRVDGVHLTHEGNAWVADQAFEVVKKARYR